MHTEGPWAIQPVIDDLKKRIAAIDAGETTGYGEIQSLRTQLEVRVDPLLAQYQAIVVGGGLEDGEEEQLRELRILASEARTRVPA